MARRGGQQFEKRRLEQNRQSKQAEKRERRLARDGAENAVDEAELNERFRLLSERRAAGDVDAEQYERERHEIFVALGLEEDTGTDSED